MAHANDNKIGLATATITGMNAMIGAGIFSVPAALASNVGPAGIISYLFVILAVWCMGSSLARLAQLYPQEGSFYTYAKQWSGHLGGLLAGGCYLLGLLIAMGLLAQVAGMYLHTHIPFLSAYQLGLIVLILLTVLNMVGVKLSEVGQLILICTTVLPLVLTIIICLTKASFANLSPFMPHGITNIFAATKAVIFGFFGFECAASLFTIVKDPEKNVSKALTYAIIIVGAIYLAFVTSLILAIPSAQFTDIELSETLRKVFPEWPFLIGCIHFSILSAVIGTVHSMIWSASMLFISFIKQFKTPALYSLSKTVFANQSRAVAVIGLCIFVSYITLTKIDQFFNWTSIFIIFAFAMSIISLLTIKQEWSSGRNIITVIGLAMAGVIFAFALYGLLA